MSKLTNFIQLRHLSYKINTRSLSTTKDEIVIPKRINRGPTDILRALEATIKRDYTAPHYKYHDDPYLIPMSNMSKRTYAMAQESGRKAAHWVRQQHPDLFMHSEAVPTIKSYLGKILPDEKDLNESHLIEAIQCVNVSDAVTIYKSLVGKEISNDTKQSLLELLCYYNCKDTIDEEFIEERWFRNNEKGKERHRKTWIDGGLAEEIFISIENPDGDVYSTIIQGMAKHYQVDRAWQLFQEAQEKKISLNIECFNSIISITSFIMEGYDKRWNLILDLLNRIKLAKLKPNINTLNTTLEVLGTIAPKMARDYSLQVLSEFKKIGVEPSLGSWALILNIFCKDRGPISTILNDIMNEIENKEFHIKHIKDISFFSTAMDVCNRHLHDKYLAKRVNDLLFVGNNYDLIGDSYKESIYYRNYFLLLSETQPLETFMEETYNKLVPHIYVPEPSVMGEILNMVSLNAAVKYVPKLWSHLKIFEMTGRENLLKAVIEIMIKDELEDVNLKKQFADIAWDIFNIPSEWRESLTAKFQVTAEMLSNLLIIILRNDDFSKATTIMDKLYTDHHNVMGVPKIESMQLYLDQCIKELSPSQAIMCIQYCYDCGFQEVDAMASKLNEQLTLNEKDLEKLSRLSTQLSLGKNLESAKQ